VAWKISKREGLAQVSPAAGVSRFTVPDALGDAL